MSSHERKEYHRTHPPSDRTDWERVDALTDEEIEQAVAEDPDAELLDAEWFRTAQLVVPTAEKTRINDVLKASTS